MTFHLRTPATALAIALTLATPALAADTDRTPLTGPELTTLLSGNTETWSTLGAGYYDPAAPSSMSGKTSPAPANGRSPPTRLPATASSA